MLKTLKLYLALLLLTQNISADNVNCCNPCQLQCVVAGCFSVGPIPFANCPICIQTLCGGSATTNASVLKQCGNQFWVVSNTTLGQFTVQFNQPFCHIVDVTVSDSAGTASITSTANDSFVLNNVSGNSTVCFIATPIAK